MAIAVASGQYQRVVIIDTITINDQPPEIRKINQKIDTSEFFSWPLAPEHIMQVYFLDTLQNLEISIDSKSGYIELKNTFHCSSDTIRIAHIRYFHNCVPDSIYTTKDWYLRNPRDTQEQLKYLRSESYYEITQRHLHKIAAGGKKEYKRLYGIKNCKENFPNKYSICINERQYAVPLNFRWQDAIRTVGHGYKSRRHSKRYHKYNKAAIYFHFHSRTINHALHAEVDLCP